MRILMLAPPAHIRSPLSKHTPHLVAALRDLGCSVQVEAWGSRRESEAFSEKITTRGADILRIRQTLRAERFDMLVVKTALDWNTLSRDIPLLLAARGLCARRVLQFHGGRVDRLVAPGHRAFKLVTALLVRLSDAALVLSSQQQSQWQAYYPAGRVSVVKNPLCPAPPTPSAASRRRLGIPENVPVVLFVGRLLEMKGVFDLITAFSAVCANAPCHLLVAGDGPATDEVKRRAVSAGVSPHVTMAGYLEGAALRAAYSAADVFALPSWGPEGFPFAILEAMDAGLPVVTTKIGGVVDHLREGVHALLIPPRDTAALTSALLRILADAELRARMGRVNRAKVQEFAPDIVGREYLAVLRSIAATTQERAR